jgi:hypothetical protein
MSKYSCFNIFATTLINFSEFNDCKLYRCQHVFFGTLNSGLPFLAMIFSHPGTGRKKLTLSNSSNKFYRQDFRLLKGFKFFIEPPGSTATTIPAFDTPFQNLVDGW